MREFVGYYRIEFHPQRWWILPKRICRHLDMWNIVQSRTKTWRTYLYRSTIFREMAVLRDGCVTNISAITIDLIAIASNITFIYMVKQPKQQQQILQYNYISIVGYSAEWLLRTSIETINGKSTLYIGRYTLNECNNHESLYEQICWSRTRFISSKSKHIII